jgi:hypothetical protein
MAGKRFPLLNHFRARLVGQVGEFINTQIFYGVLLLGIASVGFTVLHLGLTWGNALENITALLCSILWVVCVFALIVVWRAACALWKEPRLPSNSSLIVLTDKDDSVQKTSFLVRLVLISLLLMAFFFMCGLSAGLFAYRTAIAPVLTPEELDEFAASIVVGVRKERKSPLPSEDPIATGFWVGRKGYVVTCLISVPTNQRSMEVMIPFTRLLREHETMSGIFVTVDAKVKFRDDESNLGILHTNQNFFDEAHLVMMGRDMELSSPKLAAKHAKSGEQIVRVGFLISPPNPTSFDFAPGYIGGGDFQFDGSGSRYPLSLSVPYRPTDCGSPVLNDRGVLVGVVTKAGSAQGLSDAAPSTFIQNWLKKIDLTY